MKSSTGGSTCVDEPRGLLSEEQIREIRAANDPVDVLERYADRVIRSGYDFKACCPIHGERTPSLHVYADRVTDGKPYKCFGCGWTGDQIDLVKQMEACDFREAAEKLSRGVPLTAAGHLTPAPRRPAPPPCLWEPVVPAPVDAEPLDRLWGHKKADWAYGGRAPDHQFIYRNHQGEVIGIVCRFNIGNEKMTPMATWCRHPQLESRWVDLAMPEPRPLYRLDLLSSADPVIFTEGEKAAEAAARLFPDLCVCAAPGGTNGLDRVDLSPLRGRSVIVWPDNDEPGTKYAYDLADRLGGIFCIDRRAVASILGHELGKGFDAADVPDGTDVSSLIDAAIFIEANVDKPEPVRGAGDDPPSPPPEPPTVAEPPPDPDDGNAYHRRVVSDLERYLLHRNITPDAMEGMRHSSRWNLLPESVDSIAREWAFEARNRYKVSCQYATESLEVIVKRQRRERRSTLVESIVSADITADGYDALQAWVAAVVDVDAPAFTVDEGAHCPMTQGELATLALLHWIRNCKRLAIGLKPEHDIMIVVHGPQGSGKTTAVERLVEPWKELAIAVDAAYLTDDRRAPALTQAIIGRWEEMSGARKADIEALKNTITAQTISWRPMRTNLRTEQPKSISLIGTSNITVDQMVADVTGARRFIQINTPKQCDWQQLNAIDPNDIWQAIGPNDQSQLVARLDDIRQHQAELIHRDPIQMWYDAETWARLELRLADTPERPVVWEPYDASLGVSFEEIAARFAHWCRATNQPALGTRMLSQRIPLLGISHRFKTVPGRGRGRRYFLPEGHTHAKPF